jgi:hypothetical protein
MSVDAAHDTLPIRLAQLSFEEFAAGIAGQYGGEAPRRANFSAAASPMPEDAPVSRTRLPARSTGLRRRRSACSVNAGRMLVSNRLSDSRRSGLLLTE